MNRAHIGGWIAAISVTAMMVMALFSIVTNHVQPPEDVEYGPTLASFMDSNITKIQINDLGPDGIELTIEKVEANRTIHMYGWRDISNQEYDITVKIGLDSWLTYEQFIAEYCEEASP